MLMKEIFIFMDSSLIYVSRSLKTSPYYLTIKLMYLFIILFWFVILYRSIQVYKSSRENQFQWGMII